MKHNNTSILDHGAVRPASSVSENKQLPLLSRCQLSTKMAQQGRANTTAVFQALSPWLDNPGRVVIQVEVLVITAATLLLLQLVLCSRRRQSGNTFIQVGASVSYTMSFPLVTYTLGMMQSSPVKNVLYPVWAVSLFLVAGSTNVITFYDLDDNRHLFELFQYALYSGMNIKLLFPSHGSAEEVPNRAESSFAQHLASRLNSATPVIMILNLIVFFTMLSESSHACGLASTTPPNELPSS